MVNMCMDVEFCRCREQAWSERCNTYGFGRRDEAMTQEDAAGIHGCAGEQRAIALFCEWPVVGTANTLSSIGYR